MSERIDLRGLSEEDVRKVQRYADILREKARARELRRRMEKGEIRFRSWPLGVKGGLTRDEIYGHL